MVKLTPIEIELMRNGLMSICDEMFLAIMKSAYSTNIKERHDHSAAIFDAQGRVVVQGESLPLHLASMLGHFHAGVPKSFRQDHEQTHLAQ